MCLSALLAGCTGHARCLSHRDLMQGQSYWQSSCDTAVIALLKHAPAIVPVQIVYSAEACWHVLAHSIKRFSHRGGTAMC